MTDDLKDTLEGLTDEALEQLDIWFNGLDAEGTDPGTPDAPLELTLSAAVTLGGVSLGTLRLELNPNGQRRELIRGDAATYHKETN